MQALPDLVAALSDGFYKNHYSSHMQRGLHPAEERFARLALLALAPDAAAPKEKKEAARRALSDSLEELPETRSGEIFRKELQQRFPEGALLANLEIEEMIFISNIASALAASADKPYSQQTEIALKESEEELTSWATVSGKEPARPMAIEKGLFWLYYLNCNDLRGVCTNSLPGKGQGLPIVFAHPEYFPGGAIDKDAVLRVACHEMIHSSQGASLAEDLEGWTERAKFSLLEAVTEGLAICRIGKREPFSSREIADRDYAYFVLALFNQMREAGIPLSEFPERLEEMNASLSRAATLPPEDFLKRVSDAMHQLLLHSVALKSQHSSANVLEEVLYTGELGIIDEVLLAQL